MDDEFAQFLSKHAVLEEYQHMTGELKVELIKVFSASKKSKGDHDN